MKHLFHTSVPANARYIFQKMRPDCFDYQKSESLKKDTRPTYEAYGKIKEVPENVKEESVWRFAEIQPIITDYYERSTVLYPDLAKTNPYAAAGKVAKDENVNFDALVSERDSLYDYFIRVIEVLVAREPQWEKSVIVFKALRHEQDAYEQNPVDSTSVPDIKKWKEDFEKMVVPCVLCPPAWAKNDAESTKKMGSDTLPASEKVAMHEDRLSRFEKKAESPSPSYKKKLLYAINLLGDRQRLKNVMNRLSEQNINKDKVLSEISKVLSEISNDVTQAYLSKDADVQKALSESALGQELAAYMKLPFKGSREEQIHQFVRQYLEVDKAE